VPRVPHQLKFLPLVLATFGAIFFAGASAHAQSPGIVYLVTSPQAPLFLSADESRKSNTLLSRGRRIEVSGPEQNGFVPISTRAGAKAWIRIADVRRESPPNEFLEPVVPSQPPPAIETQNQPAPRRRTAAPPPKERSRFGLQKLTFDLGGSGGSVNGVSYTEIDLGLNAYFYDWLAWRNAVFGRFASGQSNLYGLDSSVRGILSLGSVVGFTAFAGPGYRFVNQGGNVPFLEGGLVFKFLGIAVGGGVKTLLTSAAQSGAPNDTQYFLILAGGGSL
jgi:hypothetical protein